MRKNILLMIVLILFFILAGCMESNPDSPTTPEEALKMVEEERDLQIFGSHQVNDEIVLFVIRGPMNDEDIWVADIRQEDGQWSVSKLILMNGPTTNMNLDETESVFADDDFEVGYMWSDAEPEDEGDITIVDVDEDSEWKIWIKAN